MSETKNVAKLLNPWVFHLQKLGLELKCPLCLDLLKKPMLLPCNHIFCNCCIPKSCLLSTQCPVCQHSFTDKEIRTASCMENIVAVYQSLDSSLKSVMMQLSSTGAVTSVLASEDQSRKTLGEKTLKRKNNGSDALIINSVARGIELTKCDISEESEVNHGPEISPGSSPSFGDAKDVVDNSTPDRLGGIVNYEVKKSIGDKLGTAAAGVDNNNMPPTREPKRQKKLHYGLSDAVLKCHEYSQRMGPHSGQAALSNFSEECKSKEDTSAILSTTPFNGSYVNGGVCAFCQSSTITDATGRLLHYADEKEVSRDEPAFSKAIPVHSKCIEWAPQVYFVGETIHNLESELARASKLKCSSCGLKGAALGCFAKSCRKTYHVPCAIEIPDCRWDFDDYLMLCPVHKSVKFPSEKSKSRKKRHSEEKCSLTRKIASEQLNFWTASTKGPQEWVLCGSALSSEEKCLVVTFARICGATFSKSWDPNVTHVIAATDSNGACSRTLKVLMAILNGRWVLTMDWIKACLEGNRPVSEELYEVNLDNHGCRDGPRNGRLRVSNNAPKLFDGLRFYFSGDFAYKNDLLDLVEVGGGKIIESFEEAVVQTDTEQTIPITLVVYNHDSPEGIVVKEATSFVSKRLAEAEALAKCIDAQVIPHKWILESIAASSLSPYPSC